LRDGLSARLEVTGRSMTPFVQSGDRVTVKPADADGLSFGDVVVFAAGGHALTVHRIVGWSGEAIRSRGDMAGQEDAPVARHEVLGVVTRVERRGKRLRLGLGPERSLIARLSRLGVFARLGRICGCGSVAR
jgi:hypothetical protein